MKHQFFFGNPNKPDYDNVLNLFAQTKIDSIQTSSIPLVQFWKETEERFNELKTRLDIPFTEDIKLCFEYPVSPELGKGKPSMTDLMILSGSTQIAIEAKYTEYVKMKPETVADWLKGGDNSDNRKSVLDSWWNMIAPFRKQPDMDDTIEYQFLHRTASACRNATQAVVVYQVFYDNATSLQSRAQYKADLKKYAGLIAPNEKLKFYIWEIEAIPQDITVGKNPFEEMKNKAVFKFGKMELESL